MSPKIDVFNLAGGGVNLVKNPLQLADDEVTQAQNAELIPDEQKGGDGALSKRGGIAALTSALAGAVTGIISLPLQTTYTKTLLASLGSHADKFVVTSNGTSWASHTTPLQCMRPNQLPDELNYHASLRAASIGNAIYYPGSDYTHDISSPANGTAPPIAFYDGTNALELFDVPIGPNVNNYHSHGILDMLVADGLIYFTTWDPDNSGGADAQGRVFTLNPVTGEIKQIANAFGDATGEVTGGYPSALCFYNGQLFVGQNQSSGGSGSGKIVKCYPENDTTWTVDVSNLGGDITSIAAYKSRLYAGQRAGSIGSDVMVSVRNPATGAWTASYTAAGSAGLAHAHSLIVFNDDLYMVETQDTISDICHIKKFDGTSWTTDRDVDNLDGWVAGQHPRTAVVWESALYIAFQATLTGETVNNDGFILRKSSGTWTKVYTGNVGGVLLPLVIRS